MNMKCGLFKCLNMQIMQNILLRCIVAHQCAFHFIKAAENYWSHVKDMNALEFTSRKCKTHLNLKF